MLRSIAFIKFVHTVIFIFLSSALVVLLYEVIVDKITLLTWIAVVLLLAESIVLIANGWKCPLTTYVERLGSTHGQVTDIFLPRRFADRIFQICGSLWAIALLLLAIRMLG
jgi:polyferredoxin